MSNDKQRGRADAAQGKYSPPSRLFPLPSGDKAAEKARLEYREGHGDKKREIEQAKKKH
jgi:hypothetical protein